MKVWLVENEEPVDGGTTVVGVASSPEKAEQMYDDYARSQCAYLIPLPISHFNCGSSAKAFDLDVAHMHEYGKRISEWEVV